MISPPAGGRACRALLLTAALLQACGARTGLDLADDSPSLDAGAGGGAAGPVDAAAALDAPGAPVPGHRSDAGPLPGPVGSGEVHGETDGGRGAHAGTSEIVHVQAGSYHTCAVRRSGEVLCWGANERAQLGLRGPDRVSAPQVVVGTGNATRLALGRWHSCALRADAQVVCWGDNRWAQLGSAAGDSARSEPRLVPGLRDVRAIAAGWVHTCALLASGAVRCWGRNDAGQLGNGRVTLDPPEPVAVVDMRDAVQIGAGRATSCARLRSGEVRCWGDGTSRPAAPVVEDARALSIGDRHGCVLRADGAMGCWGDLGCRLFTSVSGWSIPTPAGALDTLSGGYAHHCAVGTDGSVVCWGRHDHALRVEEDCERFEPIAWLPEVVALSSPARDVAAGFGHTCVVHDPGVVSCWGANGHGQLGDGTVLPRAEPLRVRALP